MLHDSEDIFKNSCPQGPVIWYTISFRYVNPSEEDVDGFESFQTLLDADKKAGKKPLMCVANVHSTIFQKQTVTKLQVALIINEDGI